MPAAPVSPFILVATGGGLESRQHDLGEVKRALRILADPEFGIQLHHAPFYQESFATFSGSDVDGMAAWVAGHDRATGIYYGLNPVSRSQDTNQISSDIIRRRWLLIDIDRVKTNEDKDQSATEEEHEAARDLAEAVFTYLDGLGWPAPLLVDSGNGFHLLFRVDLPNDRIITKTLGAFLKALAAKFPGVGRECHDARRVAKLPGTWARKGADTPRRPHRMAKLLHAPAESVTVSLDQIRQATEALRPAVSNSSPQQTPTPPPDTPFILSPTGGRDAAYARRAFESELAKLSLAKPGGLNEQLFRSGAAMGNFVGAGLLDEGEVFARLLEKIRDAGADNPRKDEDTLRRAIEKGKAEPRGAPQLNGAHTPAADAVPPGDLIIYRASSVTPRKVEWLWQDRIPLGKLTTFAGVGGLGKTFVLCDTTARVSRGMDWPDSAGECCEPGQVLFISGEDDADDTLVPRLIELGADLSRVVFLKTEVLDRFTLADLKTLDKAIEQSRSGEKPPVRFVAIDPPTAYLGDVDDHKNAELRGLLSPLKSWAAKHRVAVVFNTHVNKGGGQKVEAMARVMGSVAWVNAVRAAHMFSPDPDDADRCLFIPMKMNLAKKRKGLAYQIIVTDALASLKWLGDVDTSADDAMNRQVRQSRAIQATDFLTQLFAGRRELPSEEVWAARRGAGLSENAVKEAKAKLRIQAVRRCLPGNHQIWVWIWPFDVPIPGGYPAGGDPGGEESI